ncbi:ATP-dependent Clp protease ATP-binding subunit ClpA [Ichthyobacterium seriolicida]|uniref:ATP-dependent Clp protease ATP-binding subunit ClpA n=2 Tax=Ichthyobacterium seriolicida TaxID=242600 RepID=A0A1J1E2C8_9FLAO|nr:ATP-dependent Clp protease ATP-binding subunit ClpA [Ichthyobacterium seriolicida]
MLSKADDIPVRIISKLGDGLVDLNKDIEGLIESSVLLKIGITGIKNTEDLKKIYNKLIDILGIDGNLLDDEELNSISFELEELYNSINLDDKTPDSLTRSICFLRGFINLCKLGESEYINIPYTKEVQEILDVGLYAQAEYLEDDILDTIHLFLSILKNKKDPVTIIMNRYSIDYNRVIEEYKSLDSSFFSLKDVSNKRSETFDEEEEEKKANYSSMKDKKMIIVKKKNNKTPTLNLFSKDLTFLAEEGKLDPIIGREKEIKRLSQVLSRRKKNNPILIGEPGVGKSAIAEGLALRIANKKISRVLSGKRVLMLDLAGLVAGTKYRGQFEERLKHLLEELESNKDIILFIDEIHTIVGVGNATGSMDASNMFKPALARGQFQCIGATTISEYRQYIEKDGALARRFQKIIINPTSKENTLEILLNIKDKYEDYHNVTYTNDAIKACIELSSRYIFDRNLPDKAIDILDETGANVHIKNIKVPKELTKLEKKLESVKLKKKLAVRDQLFEKAANLLETEEQLKINMDIIQSKWHEQVKKNRQVISEHDVSEVISVITGIPANKITEYETNMLVDLPKRIKKEVIGQDQAIDKVAKSIQRNRVGFSDPDRPIGSFIFLGPTGVGKTKLAKVINDLMFNSDDSLIRIDMNEYMEKFSLSRLLGAPPGYVGYEEGGQLTERVRTKPYSVILLDEIEKAHPDIMNSILQILDEGEITDNIGRKINFRNTIIIMTSNVGARKFQDFGTGVGFETSAKQEDKDLLKDKVLTDALKKHFSPEFLSRIDDFIIFNSLTKRNIMKIIDLELLDLASRIKRSGYGVEISKSTKSYIAKKGYNKDYGIRYLKKTIQKLIEDSLIEEVISKKIREGDNILIDMDNEEKIHILKQG